jgi:alkaline phosphatase D
MVNLYLIFATFGDSRLHDDKKNTNKMKSVLVLLGCYIIFFNQVFGQWAAGPLLGPVELREAKVWMATQSAADEVELTLKRVGEDKERIIKPVKYSNYEFNTCVFTIGGLEPATDYTYTVSVKDTRGKNTERKGKIKTKTLFQWRTPAPDFSFLTGSCSYFNEPGYDRPGRPYGLDSSIFEVMAKEPAAFMLWLGDNWYTREVDYQSNWGLWYRAWRDRSLPVLQNLWSSMGHIATWDDHDYGPNDYGKSYHLKNTSRDVFQHFWLNHNYGDGKDGIYTRYQYNDIDFFLLDNRWWRDYDKLPDSVNGKPNPEKKMLGKQQMDWLKEELRYSKANPFVSFRIIAVGSQVLNPVSPFDKMLAFPSEYYEFINFLKEEKIEGVLFFTGDRHHSEVIKVSYEGLYPLFDVTSSPLSSGTHKFGGPEANNPYRVVGVDQLQNYSRVSVSGQPKARILQVEFVGAKGNVLDKWLVNEQELKMPK